MPHPVLQRHNGFSCGCLMSGVAWHSFRGQRTEHHPWPALAGSHGDGDTTSCPEGSHWWPSCVQLQQSQGMLGVRAHLCPQGWYARCQISPLKGIWNPVSSFWSLMVSRWVTDREWLVLNPIKQQVPWLCYAVSCQSRRRLMRVWKDSRHLDGELLHEISRTLRSIYRWALHRLPRGWSGRGFHLCQLLSSRLHLRQGQSISLPLDWSLVWFKHKVNRSP